MGRLLSRSLKDSWMMCLVNIIYIYMYIYVANFRFFEPKLIGCLQVLYQRCIYYLKNTADTMWADVTCGAAGTLLAVIQLIQLEPGKKWSTISWDWGCNPQKLTWNLEMMVSNRNLLFQGSIFRFHVCFGWFDVPPIPQLPKPRKIHENLRLPKWIQSENLRWKPCVLLASSELYRWAANNPSHFGTALKGRHGPPRGGHFCEEILESNDHEQGSLYDTNPNNALL